MFNIINTLSIHTYTLIPLFILISFVLLLVLIYINRKFIKAIFSEIDIETWIILSVIFFIALLIRIYIPPHQHIMYIDESWYMKAGKDMLQFNSVGWYPKSIGWPFILSISFLIFGVSNWVAIFTTIFFGSLTVFTLFFLTYVLTKNQNVSLVSSLIFSLFAAHIRWSATAETNVVSLFFITSTLFFCFLYYRKGTVSLLWLSLTSLAFTSQIRPENHIFAFLFLIGLILFKPKKFRLNNYNFLLPWLVFLVLITPNLLPR